MFDVNEYFEGKVKSIAYQNESGQYTVGVMAQGDYEFGTSSNEEMTVVEGKLTILFENETEWKIFDKGTSFNVSKGDKFKVKVEEPTSYLCRYY